MTRPNALRALVSAFAILVLAVFHPWQVRSLNAPVVMALHAAAPAHDLDALWRTNLAKTSQPLSAASFQAQLFEGTGRVISIDHTSRVGKATIEAADGIKVLMQVGPVLNGTDLRDAFGLKFGDFDTQVDYAGMAEALNGKALQALTHAQGLFVPGKTIRFTGAGIKVQEGVIALVPMTVEAAP